MSRTKFSPVSLNEEELSAIDSAAEILYQRGALERPSRHAYMRFVILEMTREVLNGRENTGNEQSNFLPEEQENFEPSNYS